MYQRTTATLKIQALTKKIRGIQGGTSASKTISTLDAFDQLEVRTKKGVFLDWNPTNEFWFYTDVLGKRDDVDLIILTYKDNEALSPEIVNSIEQRRERKGWWKVYGEGQLGEVEGKIYKDWQIIDELPHEARLERYGLDFGYSVDPTAVIAVYYYNGGYILDEIAFQKGLSNKQIADILKNQELALTIADSAEPKSIDEISSYGVQITGAVKGADSVNHGISVIQAQRISMTKRSINLIKAYRNYLWETDKQGKIIPKPDHTWSDALDAARYGLVSVIKDGSYMMEEENASRLLSRLKQERHSIH